MKRFTRKLVTLLTVMLLVAAISVAANATPEDAGPMALQLDTPTDITFVGEIDESVCLTFTPEKTGIYVLVSQAEGSDPVVNVYDDEDNHIANRDSDYYGNDPNFTLFIELEAGREYTFYVFNGDAAGTFPVLLYESVFAGITLNPVTVTEYMDGYHTTGSNEEDGEFHYFHYEWKDKLTGTVNLADGSTIPVEGGKFVYNGEDIYVPFSDLQALEKWTVGNTYTVYVEFATVRYPVSVSVEPVNAQQLALGQVQTLELKAGEENSWLYKFVPQKTSGYLFYSFEMVDDVDPAADLYDAEMKMLQQNDDCATSWDFMIAANLEAGKTYYLKAAGREYNAGSFKMQVIEFPVQSASINPISVIEGTNGYYTYDENGAYFRYSLDNDHINGTVNFANGTTAPIKNGIVDYNGLQVGVAIDDDQSFENQWTAGNTYTAMVRFAGIDCEMPVTIVESPVRSVSLKPITLMESEYKNWVNEWDDESQSSVEYPVYEWWYKLQGTVTYKDGTTGEISGTSVSYHDQYHGLGGILSGQSYANQWEIGNTYTPTFSIMGYPTQVSVTLVETVIKNIQMEPITMTVNQGGYWAVDMFYCYRWWENLNGTVTFFDDSTAQIKNGYFTYQDTGYSLEWSDEQDSENIWTVGNTYTCQLTALGYTGEVSVSISEPQAETITFGQEFTFPSDGNNRDNYYAFTPETTATYTFVSYDKSAGDPHIILLDEQMVEIGRSDDDAGDLNFMLTQELTAGTKYYLNVRNLNSALPQFKFKVICLAVQSVDIMPITLQGGMNGYWMNVSNANAYYYYNWTSQIAGTVTFADGTVVPIEDRRVNYNGLEFGLNYLDPQEEVGGWSSGNTYQPTVRLMDVEYPVSVTITPSPVTALSLNPIRVIEGLDGYMTTSWDVEAQANTPEFFAYRWNDRLSGTVTFADGTTKEFSGGIYYNNQWYGISTYNPQSYTNQWTVGNTYECTVTVADVLAKVSVTVEPFPIVSISAEPIVLKANFDGYWTESWDANGNSQGQWFVYEWHDLIDLTVVTAGGERIPVTNRVFTYNGREYYVSSNDSQSYQDRMLPGKTYQKKITLMGKTANVPITVLEPVWEGGFEYMVHDGKAIICGSSRTDAVLTIPQTLGGYPVTTVNFLGTAIRYAEQIVIPDCVTKLGNSLFYGAVAQKITVGKGVTDYNWYRLWSAVELEQIQFSSGNPSYTSVDGVVYNKAVTKLLFIPRAKTTQHVVPDTVTDVEDLIPEISGYKDLNIVFGAGVKDYVVIDGIVYNKDVTELHYANRNNTGNHNMSATVTEVGTMAFANTSYTSITVSPKVTELVYGTFMGCTNLRSVTMPENLEFIGPAAFNDCGSLQAVVIPAGVTNIQDAFANSAVDHIFYKGTEAQWKNIEKYFDEGNYTIHYEATGNEMTLETDGNQLKMYCSICDEWSVIAKPVKPLRLIRLPMNNSAYSGKNASVTVKAEGEGVTYRWYYRDPGASDFQLATNCTGDTYTVQMSAARDGREVYCMVSDKATNTIRTDTVVLSMRTPLKVQEQPTDVVAASGKTASVNVVATGDDLTYTWYHKNATASKFAKATVTGDTYTATMTSSANGRYVYCVITDRYGTSVTTDTVNLYMGNVAKITTQPKNGYAASGKVASVTVKATGDGLSYTWYHKNATASKFAKATATGATYSATMSSSANGRYVYCMVTDQYGNSIKTNTVRVLIGNTVKLTAQPTNGYAASGKAASVTVKATGDGLSYTWYHKNATASKFAKASVTGATYSATMSSSVNGRYVYCVVADKYGNSIKTDTVRVYIGNTAKITAQPTNGYAPSGKAASVTVKATGDGLSYTWYHKNATASKFAKATATGATYTAAMSSSANGRYVYCVVTDKYGNSVTTNTVRVYVGNPVKITTQPKNGYAPSGKAASVTVKATGDGLTYTWYHKNASASKFAKASVTGATYSATMSSSANGRYVYCVVADKYGNSIKTDTVRVYIGNTAKITAQPTNGYAPSGKAASVTVKATGDGLTYTWYHKNATASKFAKASATGATYSATMSSSANGRYVYCVVTDKYGNSVTTNTVRVYVGNPVKITTQPTNGTAANGKVASVTVKATGDGLSYTWYHKNATASKFAKATATGATYKATMSASSNGRNVYCVVTDKYGNSVKTNTVTLKIK